MNISKKVFLIAGIAAALTAPVFADDHGDKDKGKEEIVEWDNVPAAVQSTIQDNSSGGQVVSVEKETKTDGTEYEARVKGTDGRMNEIKVSADGKLIKVEADDEDEHGKDKDKDDDD